MEIIKCPNCYDIWVTDKKYKKCKCYKCGYEYEPTIIEMYEFVYKAFKKCKGEG